MESKDRAKARHRALAALGKKYRSEYQALYREEIERLGGDAKAPEREPQPAIVAFEDCSHAKSTLTPEGKRCLECGATRPANRWAWQRPEGASDG